MRTLATIVFILISQASYADCYGSGTFKNCYDRETGNNYTIQRYGNQLTWKGATVVPGRAGAKTQQL